MNGARVDDSSSVNAVNSSFPCTIETLSIAMSVNNPNRSTGIVEKMKNNQLGFVSKARNAHLRRLPAQRQTHRRSDFRFLNAE
jgi:hypothetical protein